MIKIPGQRNHDSIFKTAGFFCLFALTIYAASPEADLIKAIRENNLPAVQLQLKSGANDDNYNLFSSDYSPVTEPADMLASELSYAASSGDIEQIEELLQKGIKADATFDSTGITALMQAADKETAEILIKAGGNVKTRDSYGCNVLHHLAMRKSSLSNAELLIKSGAEVNELNKEGQNPLRCCGILFTENIAPDWGEIFLQLLVKAGASIDATDNHGMTLLHQATHNDNERLTKICLKLKASLQTKDSSCESPLQTAMR